MSQTLHLFKLLLVPKTLTTNMKEKFFPDLDRDTLFEPVRTQSYQNPSKTLAQEKEAVLLDLIFQIYKRLPK
jgi:hypothetical protein